MRYSIEDTTLTALGDAVRNKSGKLTKTEYVDVEPTIATFSEENLRSGYPNISYKIRCEGMSQLKVKILEEEFVNCSFQQYMYDPLRGTQIRIGGLNGVGSEKIITEPRSETGINYFTLYVQVMVPTANASNNRCKVVMELTPLDAEGNIVQASVEVKNTLTPLQMVEEIESIKEYVEPIPPAIEALKIIANGTYTAPKGIDGYSPITVAVPQEGTPTDEELTISKDGNYRFANGGWDWFINKYGDKITTKDLYSAENMFYNCSLSKLPFDLNFEITYHTFHNIKSIFTLCYYLTEIPKFNNCIPSEMGGMFNYCYKLRELDYESVKDIDWSYMEKLTSPYGGNRSSMFANCYSLRSFPMEFLNHGNPVSNYSYSIFSSLFNSCCSLDEVIDLPNPHSQASWTSNAFGSSFTDCYRLKNLTFALQDDGTPYVCPKWKSQTIDLVNMLVMPPVYIK
jgi:hypothetical protein